MNSIKNGQTGERLSFYSLFRQQNLKVIIPIIHRDYAHGRKSKKEIRESFFNTLYNYLDENKPNRDLDFVYGILTQEDNITHFVPLDGQQRLTTLFLLHWYLYQISETTIIKKQNLKTPYLRMGNPCFSMKRLTVQTNFVMP
ncbi:MAG: DUF262 domain-containing protein [Bacteroidales bacterium]|nr:DUF262 domain-containing protein [Bacteroidales bacterium]